MSEDYQVTPNNDYYQNLSYSVKSSIPWDTMSGPVNSILHPAGMKNFADVGITSATDTGVGLVEQLMLLLFSMLSMRKELIQSTILIFTVDDDVEQQLLVLESV